MPETVYEVLEERGLTEQDLPGYTGEITTDPADYEVGAGTYVGQVTNLLGLDDEADDDRGLLDKLADLGLVAVLLVGGLIVLVVLK